MEVTEIKIIHNGPIHVKGNFKIIRTNGTPLEIKDEAWLCRCGDSKNKPLCDGRHKTVGVKD